MKMNVTLSDGEEGSGDGEMEVERMQCQCQHGTDGPNCATCLPDHWDRPWKRATQASANECKRMLIFRPLSVV